MKTLLALLLCPYLAAQISQYPAASGGGAPTGAAGGALTGTYPNPGLLRFTAGAGTLTGPATSGAVSATPGANAIPQLDASGNSTVRTVLSLGTPGTYTLSNSGIRMLDGSGNEVWRLWGTDPDCDNDFNCQNLYIGWKAGFGQPTDNTSAGYRNLGIFSRSLFSITTGFDNYAIGDEALFSLTEGSDNQAYGYFALHSVTIGQGNTANGNSALSATTGDNNTAMGATAGFANGTGSNNSFFGKDADTSLSSVQNSTALGSGTIVTKSNQAVIGNDATVETQLKGNVIVGAAAPSLGGLDATAPTTANSTKPMMVKAGPTPTQNGALAFNTTTANYEAGQSSGTVVLPTVSGTPTTGHAAKFAVTSGKVQVTDAGGTGAITVASGTASLGTSAISSGACATVVTVAATGTLSTDTIEFTPNASIKAVAGYAPVTTGGLSVSQYPTADNVNFDVCNWASGSITPGAVTLNWRVVR